MMFLGALFSLLSIGWLQRQSDWPDWMNEWCFLEHFSTCHHSAAASWRIGWFLLLEAFNFTILNERCSLEYFRSRSAIRTVVAGYNHLESIVFFPSSLRTGSITSTLKSIVWLGLQHTWLGKSLGISILSLPSFCRIQWFLIFANWRWHQERCSLEYVSPN